MDDQWVEVRPALGFVDARYGFRIGRVRGQPVDRLGRDRDRLSGENQPRGLRD